MAHRPSLFPQLYRMAKIEAPPRDTSADSEPEEGEIVEDSPQFTGIDLLASIGSMIIFHEVCVITAASLETELADDLSS